MTTVITAKHEFLEPIVVPATGLRGHGRYDTRTFAKSVTGTLVKGDGNLLEVGDLGINGQAGMHAYPHFHPDWVKEKLDLAGPDAPVRAVGLQLTGDDCRASNIRLRDIPGTGAIFAGGDWLGSDIDIRGARQGLILNTPDGKFQNIYIGGVIEDGLTIGAQGVVVIGDHVSGAGGAACRIKAPARFTSAYHEAAAIGTLIEPGADGTVIEGLDVGPGTCWDRCVKICAHGCSVTGIRGEVRLNEPVHPDSGGIEIAPGMVHTVVEGSLVIQWDKARPDATAVGVIYRGDRGTLDLRGGWNAPTGATYVRAEGDINGGRISIRGKGDGGCVLDASKASWRDVKVDLSWEGSAKRFKPPMKATNCEIRVDGVLQTKENAK